MFEALMVGTGLLGFLHEIEVHLARWWKHSLQGVRGACNAPGGEREGRSPLA